MCADVVYFLGTRHELQELDRLLQKMEIMSETSYFLLSGGFLSAASRYHKLIKLLITLQVQRSSTGLVLKQLKHYMLASHVLHLYAASGFLHFLKTDSSGSQAASTLHALQWKQSFPSLWTEPSLCFYWSYYCGRFWLAQVYTWSPLLFSAKTTRDSPVHKFFKSKMQVLYILRGSIRVCIVGLWFG